MDSVPEVSDLLLQFLPILLPSDSVDSGRSLFLESEIAVPQSIHVHVMQQGGELLLLILAGGLPHSSKSLGHTCPALRPACAVLFGVPLGWTASLHPLHSSSRCWLGRLLVRVLRWYYPSIRLPSNVHVGLMVHGLHQPARLVLWLRAFLGSPGSRA